MRFLENGEMCHLIPNIKLVGYGRSQTYQICCLKCGDCFFNLARDRDLSDLFCDDCIPEERCLREDNSSAFNYVGNIVGWIVKSSFDGKTKRRSRYNYKKVYVRDCFTCQYCGYNLKEYEEFRPLHIDHIKPWSAGGSNKMSNLVVSCSKCNLRANDKWFTSFDEKKNWILKRNKITVKQQETNS